MTKTEAAEARRALDHACHALTDGVGRDTWGPGVIMRKMEAEWYRDQSRDGLRAAIAAFERASNVAWVVWGYRHRNAHFNADMEHADCVRMAEQTRKIGHVILDCIIADAEEE